jgi:GH25 family lysozyme M1 (1,4-beta-N-acetylmuramidase)
MAIVLNPDYVLGFDVSVWQDNNSTAQQINFPLMYSRGGRFVLIKLSQDIWADPDMIYNWENAKYAGLLRGGYHFLTWNRKANLQAEAMWKLVEHDPGEFPLVVDYEYWNPMPSKAYDWLWGFKERIYQLSGRQPIIYSGTYFWGETTGTVSKSPVWADSDLWVACYTTQELMEKLMLRYMPWTNWSFWQFTSKGDGLYYGAESLNIDMNYFNGTYEQLVDRYVKGIVTPVVTEPVIEPVQVVDYSGAVMSAISNMRLRSKPDLNANSYKALLQAGETVEVTGEIVQENGYNWLPVNYKGFVALSKIGAEGAPFFTVKES